jgi:hypothetical protein
MLGIVFMRESKYDTQSKVLGFIMGTKRSYYELFIRYCNLEGLEVHVDSTLR